jgi:hypothetical protein
VQNLNFEKDKTYVDRINNQYVFIEKRGNVTIFEDILGRTCRNSIGRYRWDDKDTDMDIIGALDERNTN